MNLTAFIRHNIEDILQEWEKHAFALQPGSGSMNKEELRDHAEKVLLDIADGIDLSKSVQFRNERSRGMHPILGKAHSSAVEHGITRHGFGFDIDDVLSEYRAMRRSVIRLWTESREEEPHWDEILLFNEELDGVIKEAVEAFTAAVDTERKRIENNLRESEEKYRSVFEQAAVGIGRVCFEDARLIDVNDAFSRMVGYSREELLQISWPEITHPDDLGLDLIPFREMAAGKLEDYTVEKRFIHKSGQHVWARLTLSLVRNAQGNADYEIAIIEDINERRQMQDALRRSEERWNLALENIEAGVIIATEEAQVLYWNPAARKLHGLSSPDEGFSPLEETFDLWTPDRRHKLELDERPIRRLKRGETVHGYELRLHRPDQGWEKYISYSGSIVETAEGEKLIFLTLNDLTELRSRTEELVAVNHELEAFSYSISHDLRAPLRTISGFSSILREYASQLDEKPNEYLQKIEAGVKKMDHLIDDMLRLSRISSHNIVIQEIDLSDMARAAVHELEHQNPQRHVKVVIADELKARGDEQLLKIALSNLLDNAWKYTGKTAEASIEFGSYRTDGKKVFFIRDNGAGFPMEQADRLFLPFQRLHSESEFSGTGVGLPIVHRVINRHGGEIWAEGEVGKGASFYFTLSS